MEITDLRDSSVCSLYSCRVMDEIQGHGNGKDASTDECDREKGIR